MEHKKLIISFTEYSDAGELSPSFQNLLAKAKEATSNAYAPYSHFRVGAAALLENGEIISGSNQENASSPAGICAERTVLSAVSSLHPNTPIMALAITVTANNHLLNTPVAPCGICRQSILEYEHRFHRNIEIILQGEEGKIIIVSSVKELLPLSFTREIMKN